MDKLDFFVAELKQRGIYTDLNLNVARPYKAGDGVKDYEYLGFAKAVTFLRTYKLRFPEGTGYGTVG